MAGTYTPIKIDAEVALVMGDYALLIPRAHAGDLMAVLQSAVPARKMGGVDGWQVLDADGTWHVELFPARGTFDLGSPV